MKRWRVFLGEDLVPVKIELGQQRCMSDARQAILHMRSGTIESKHDLSQADLAMDRLYINAADELEAYNLAKKYVAENMK